MAGSVGQPTMTWAAWTSYKSIDAGSWSKHNYTGALSMGYWENSTQAQNDAYTPGDFWMDSVIWKLCYVYYQAGNEGIATFKLNGSSVGTIDHYSGGAATFNIYSEITGISVATPGIKTLQIVAASKNASATSYFLSHQSLALIATSGAYSTPSGSDTPGYTVEWIPWMGWKSGDATWASDATQSSTNLGGGRLGTGASQNQGLAIDMWADTGTHTLTAVHLKNPDNGIFTFRLDATSLGTIDGYASPFTENNVSTITGISVTTTGVKSFNWIMATKNASSSNYFWRIQSVKWIRTGA